MASVPQPNSTAKPLKISSGKLLKESSVTQDKTPSSAVPRQRTPFKPSDLRIPKQSLDDQPQNEGSTSSLSIEKKLKRKAEEEDDGGSQPKRHASESHKAATIIAQAASHKSRRLITPPPPSTSSHSSSTSTDVSAESAPGILRRMSDTFKRWIPLSPTKGDAESINTVHTCHFSERLEEEEERYRALEEVYAVAMEKLQVAEIGQQTARAKGQELEAKVKEGAARDRKYVALIKRERQEHEAAVEQMKVTLREREAGFARELQVAQGQTKDAERKLNESRAFVESEDADDINSVREGLARIGDQVQKLAQKILRKLPSTFETSTFTHRHTGVVQATREDLSFLATLCADRKVSIADFINFCCTTLLLFAIHENILAPFKVGIEAGEDRYLQGLYEEIRGNEPQSRAGRWRSILYRRRSPSDPNADKTSCISIAAETLSELTSFFSALLPSDETQEPIDLTKWQSSLTSIAEEALKWRSGLMLNHLSHDYEACVYPSDEAVGELVERGDQIVAINSFGLKLQTSVVEGEGRAAQVRSEEEWLSQVEVKLASEICAEE